MESEGSRRQNPGLRTTNLGRGRSNRASLQDKTKPNAAKGVAVNEVNEAKSAVDRPSRRKFLGFSFFRHNGQVRIRLAAQSVQRVKAKIREFTDRTKALSMTERIAHLNKKLGGWMQYFAIAEVTRVWEELDGWIRRRLRMCLWKQWKRIKTRLRELQALGLKRKAAWMIANTRKGYWCIAETPQLHQALGNAYWRTQGLISLKESYESSRKAMRTA